MKFVHLTQSRLPLAAASLLAFFVCLVPAGCGDSDGNGPEDGGVTFPDASGGAGGFDPDGRGGGGAAGYAAGGGQKTGGSAGDGGGGDSGEGGTGGTDPSCDDTLKRCEHEFTYPAGTETSVEVRGNLSATGWDDGIALTKTGSKWSAKVDLPYDFEILYKYVIDGTQWVKDPTNPNERSDGQGGVNSIISPLTCEDFTCGAEPAPGKCAEEARSCALKFTYPVGSETLVELAGSMNSWKPEPMEKKGTQWVSYVPDQMWGEKITYKFVVDGDWRPDPNNPDQEDDGYGGKNSVRLVSCDWWSCGSATNQCGDVAVFDWRDAVMYFAMVDRFRDSDGRVEPVPGANGDNGHGSNAQYVGGDLKGVTEKIDYLDGLGVSAIWLSAPFENRNTPGKGMNDDYQYSAYHGYWPSPANINYSGTTPTPRPKVESRIGTDADLHALVTAAHGKTTANGHSMKVLFDYVMNHVDIESGLYQAQKNNGWFAQHNGKTVLCNYDPVCGGSCWDHPEWSEKCAFTDYLPTFDYGNAQARAWSVNDAIWWAKEYKIDGYRLDAIKHVPMTWLTDLRSKLNSTFLTPDGGRFYLVGETYTWDGYDVLKKYVDPKTKLDGQFDFPFRKQLCRAVLRKESSMKDFANWIGGNDNRYGADALMSTWVGNHDIPRVIHAAAGQAGCEEGSHSGNAWTTNYNQPSDAAPYERLAVAFAVMLTNPGLPMIYYGDEIGLAGGGDPDNRRPMVWDDSKLNAHQKALRDKVRKLGRLRGENKALTRGTRTTLMVDNDTWVYRMGGCTEAKPVIVAVNRADSVKTVSVPTGAYTELMQGTDHTGGSINMSPRSVLVFAQK